MFAAQLGKAAGEPVAASELYLACACAGGDPTALGVLDREY